MYPDRLSLGVSAARHPGPEPTRDVGGQMPDRFSGRQVDPDLGRLLHGRVGNEAHDVAFLQSIDMSLPVAENRTMYRGAELGRSALGKRRRSRHAVNLCG